MQNMKKLAKNFIFLFLNIFQYFKIGPYREKYEEFKYWKKFQKIIIFKIIKINLNFK